MRIRRIAIAAAAAAAWLAAIGPARAGNPPPLEEIARRYVAAQERAKEVIASVSTMTRAQELELKQRVNEMLVGSCGTAK